MPGAVREEGSGGWVCEWAAGEGGRGVFDFRQAFGGRGFVRPLACVEVDMQTLGERQQLVNRVVSQSTTLDARQPRWEMVTRPELFSGVPEERVRRGVVPPSGRLEGRSQEAVG